MIFKKKSKRTLDETQRSLISHYDPKSPVAEQYRTIRTNIQFASIDSSIDTIVVTSTGPSEGKSTTAANLATVMAQQEQPTLLIDADLRKPTSHYTFERRNLQGLTTVLSEQTTFEEAIQQTDIAHLDLLTSGPIPPNPAELLGSRRMNALLEEAQTEYTHVIIDTPPVLAVTDAQVLANQCDGTILVAASGKTEKEEAEKAKELLDAANGNILGVVLNQREKRQGHYYYYYGGK